MNMRLTNAPFFVLFVVNREKDDIVNGNKVEDIIVYINRLDIARRRAEKRIEALGGPAYPKVTKTNIN